MNKETNQRLLEYFESSFLKPLLEDELITDISFNGKELFYQHNEDGRLKSQIELKQIDVQNFLRHIANLSEQQFSYAEPILDISIGKYRLNAIHYAIGRVDNEKASTFSLRIASKISRIILDDNFMPTALNYLLEVLVINYQSIVIAGKTGTGKTELQKYLLQKISPFSRVIIIDNVQELSYFEIKNNLDLNSWEVNELIKRASFQELIRNALRSNPDWLIVAESRGQEMDDVLSAAMTGHPLITTLHAKDVYSIASRMTRMVLMSNKLSSYQEVLDDIYEHFRYFIFVNKKNDKNGKIIRYIEKVLEYDALTKTNILLYEKKHHRNIFNKPSTYTINLIKQSSYKKELFEVFDL